MRVDESVIMRGREAKNTEMDAERTETKDRKRKALSRRWCMRMRGVRSLCLKRRPRRRVGAGVRGGRRRRPVGRGVERRHGVHIRPRFDVARVCVLRRREARTWRQRRRGGDVLARARLLHPERVRVRLCLVHRVREHRVAVGALLHGCERERDGERLGTAGAEGERGGGGGLRLRPREADVREGAI
jgi:hypothetical protein